MNNSTPRMKPSHLTVPCTGCGIGITYNPFALTSLCTHCQAEMELQDQMGEYSPGRLKRKADAAFEGEGAKKKRAFARDDGDGSGENYGATLLHESASYEDHGAEDSGDDDEFHDAKEVIGSEVGARVADGEGGEDDGSCSDADDEGDDVDEAPDLFESTFGSKSSPSEDEDEDEDEDTDNNKPHPPIIKNPQPSDKTEHASGCTTTTTTTAGPSTPPDSPTPHPLPPDPLKDLSPHLKHLHSFHRRAIQFLPRLPLAPHRYWIGVLRLDINPKNMAKEEHFTWMRGNRTTTVRTVWHVFQQTTVSEGFALVCGRERLGWGTRMEEVDYLGCRRVVLRAVVEGSGEARGRELSEGVVTSPVGGGGGGATEVIEID